MRKRKIECRIDSEGKLIFNKTNYIEYWSYCVRIKKLGFFVTHRSPELLNSKFAHLAFKQFLGNISHRHDIFYDNDNWMYFYRYTPSIYESADVFNYYPKLYKFYNSSGLLKEIFLIILNEWIMTLCINGDKDNYIYDTEHRWKTNKQLDDEQIDKCRLAYDSVIEFLPQSYIANLISIR